jgi:subfamily B ATP-binding cassette protein MsbA
MFIPLIEAVSKNGGSKENLGNLSFIIDVFNSFGLNLTLLSLLVVMISFFSLKGIFQYFAECRKVEYVQYFIRVIRIKLINALKNLDFKNFVTADVGKIQNTLSGEVTKVTVAFGSYMQVIGLSMMIVVYTVLAVISNPLFSIMVGVGGFLTNIFFKKVYKKTKQHSNSLTRSDHDFQGMLIQYVTFFKYLKATASSNTYAQKLTGKVSEIENHQIQMGKLNAFMGSIREPLLICIVMSVMIVQVKYFGANIAVMILSVLFFYRALNSVMMLQAYWNSFMSVSGSLYNMTNFTEELESGAEKLGTKELVSFSSKIKLEKINFSIDKKEIIKDVSITISKYDLIAFVGESGSGKTTLMNVVSGLLKINNGKISIDGINYDELKMDTFQKRIGYITQEPVIFTDTIFNNVTFWSEKTEENLERFNKALKNANIHEYVYEQKEGEEFILGNNGINMSGGQKQRLSIARELYKEVDFLLFDEATSSLDSESERLIQDNINALKGKYTIIIIAHRISTIKNCDIIYFLENGCIAKSGIYNELITNSENFRKMANFQGH